MSFIAATLAFMFPETLNQSLPQTVADVENMNFISKSKKIQNENVQLNQRTFYQKNNEQVELRKRKSK